MSQNDFTIANQTFPNTRADINSALQALASTSSGSSAPSTTFANQLFYNTTSNLLQIRNEDNDAFITIAELDQTNDTVEYVKSDSVRTALIEFTDGDDALAIADGGALTVSTSLDMNGTELILDADADTSIHADTDDRIDFKTAGTDRVHFTSQGNVGVGTNAPTHVADAYKTIEAKGTDTNGSGVILATSTAGIQTQMISSDASSFGAVGTRTNHACTFTTNNTERMRLSTAGNLGVGTTSPTAKFAVSDGTTTLDMNPTGAVGFVGTRSNHPVQFTVNASTKATIDTSGRFLVGTTASIVNGSSAKSQISYVKNSEFGLFIRPSDNNTGGGQPALFQNQAGTSIGSIGATASNVSYNTSSDYRLKENVNYSFDATTRLKQLKPARFSWISDDTNTLIDGFLAHEVTSVVPDAVTGTKDATTTRLKTVKDADGKFICSDVEEADWTAGKQSSSVIKDSNGYNIGNGVSESDWTAGKADGTYPNDSTWTAVDALYPNDSTWTASEEIPDYQSIDHSKLVPLLVKTIQELEARITALES